MNTKNKADVAPAPVGSWKVTEELDSIQCPICKGYNRLSVSSDKTHVYCAECGDKITEAYLTTQGFELRVALELESRISPAQSGKHTPGPWIVNYIGGIEVWSSDSKWCIADCSTETSPLDPTVRKANARLIAAAPDLLESLKECRPWVRRWSGASGLLAMVENAIAKAERGIA